MNQNPYLKQYKKNQIETATPEQILILLYDGAIQYLNRAKVALNEQNVAQFHSNVLSCEKIIMEFMNTLDMKRDVKLAQNLYQLYDYLYNTLVKAGVSQNVDDINEVLKHLTGLRETWQKAIEIANAEKGAKLIDNEDEDEDEDDYENEEEDDDEHKHSKGKNYEVLK